MGPIKVWDSHFRYLCALAAEKCMSQSGGLSCEHTSKVKTNSPESTFFLNQDLGLNTSHVKGFETQIYFLVMFTEPTVP